MADPPLASDADRDIALALLREASVDGRLTLEDLAERAEVVHAAVLAGPEVDIEAKAVFGSVEVIVPEGVLVELSGGGALSSQELKLEGDAPEGAPVIRIHHRGVCGSLGVRSRPRLADQLKDSARALVERLQQPRE